MFLATRKIENLKQRPYSMKHVVPLCLDEQEVCGLCEPASEKKCLTKFLGLYERPNLCPSSNTRISSRIEHMYV